MPCLVPATAFTRRVLPQPGGPCSSTPRGQHTPNSEAAAAYWIGQPTSSRSIDRGPSSPAITLLLLLLLAVLLHVSAADAVWVSVQPAAGVLLVEMLRPASCCCRPSAPTSSPAAAAVAIASDMMSAEAGPNRLAAAGGCMHSQYNQQLLRNHSPNYHNHCMWCLDNCDNFDKSVIPKCIQQVKHAPTGCHSCLRAAWFCTVTALALTARLAERLGTCACTALAGALLLTAAAASGCSRSRPGAVWPVAGTARHRAVCRCGGGGCSGQLLSSAACGCELYRCRRYNPVNTALCCCWTNLHNLATDLRLQQWLAEHSTAVAQQPYEPVSQ